MKTLLILISLGCLVLPAQNPHKIDFTQALTGMDGKPMPSNDPKSPTVTLGDVAIMALEALLEEDKGMTGADKFKNDELARKVYKAKAATLSVEDIALIKMRIGKVYGPSVVGAAWRLLDPSTASPDAAKTK